MGSHLGVFLDGFEFLYHAHALLYRVLDSVLKVR